jgi:isocitrate dehydrogenase kinase/phosphatase
VQFVAALVEFVRNTSPRLNTSEEFVKFVSHKSRRNRYRELLAFFAEKNLNGSSPAAVC